MELETQEKELNLMRLIEEAKGENPLSECGLVERIDMLKESEVGARTERQELERRLRSMRFGRLLGKGAEG